MQKSKVLVNILYAYGDGQRSEQQQLSPYSYQIYPKQRKVANVVQPDHTGHVMGADDTPIRLTAGRGRHYLYFMKDKRVEWVLISKEAHQVIGQGGAFRVEPAESEVVNVEGNTATDVITAPSAELPVAEAVPTPEPEPVAPPAPDEEPAEPEAAVVGEPEEPFKGKRRGRNR
jgi:hypothetical protein